MDFNRISDNKLKVVLTDRECREYSIKDVGGEYEGASVRSSLGAILTRAESEAGFRVGSDQLLVQLYPLVDGGCEIFVTRLSSLPQKERKLLAGRDSLTTYLGRECVFRFDSLDALTAAARALSERKGGWDVYASDSGEFYVSFREHSVDGFSDFDILSE